MDPTILISGASALLTAIQTWIQYQDSARAARQFESAFSNAQKDASIKKQAEELASIIPDDVLTILTERASRCWTHYRAFMAEGPLPREAAEATEAVKKCICRELKHIADLNEGRIPDGELRKFWTAYNCVERP